MVCFEIGFRTGDYWSVNMVEVSDSDDPVESAITAAQYAASRAARYSYEDYYVSKSPLADWQVRERREKGMPMTTIPPC